MKRTSVKAVLALGSMLLSLGMANAAIPNSDHPTTFVGPTLKGGYTSTMTDVTAYSLAGEAGLKNFRVGGTLAWKLENNQRIKATLEYLWQKLTYSFFSGNTNQWVSQGALGAAYQYDFDYAYNPQFDLSAYISHAPSKSLSTVTGTFINSLGNSQAFADNRRVAGSNAAGISPGVTFQPWMGTKAGLELNYDNVRYDKNFSPNQDAKGLGGTVRINQVLTNDVDLALLAAIRKPFNNYQAGLNWYNVPDMPNWILGIDGAYTVGKNTLPNSYNVSLSANYAIDRRCGEAPRNYKGDVKGELTPTPPPHDGLVAWAADPAVYMPQVLAIPDEAVETGCGDGLPIFSGTIPDGNTAGGATTVIINTAAFFTGSNLVFSFTQSAAPAPGNTLTFDPATGVLTATGPATQIIAVTVTATNSCGTATSNSFDIIY